MTAYDDAPTSCPLCGRGLDHDQLCDHADAGPMCGRCCAVYHRPGVPAPLTGIHTGVTHFPDPAALSYSGAKDILRSPGHYQAKRSQPRETSDTFDLGNAVHYLTLGAGQPLVVVDGNRNATAVKDEIAAARAGGNTVVKSEQMAQAKAVADAILRHPAASRMLAAGHPEVYACRVLDGTRVRGWIDWVAPMCLVDLKTTGKPATPAAAEKAMLLPEHGGVGYALQAWVSSWLASDCNPGVATLLDLPPFAFVFAETTAPYVVEVYEPSRDVLAYGRAWFLRALDVFNACRESDHWPATYTGAQSTLLGLPRWAAFPTDDDEATAHAHDYPADTDQEDHAS